MSVKLVLLRTTLVHQLPVHGTAAHLPVCGHRREPGPTWPSLPSSI